MKYKIIEKEQTGDIAKLAVCLTNEIMERTGAKHFDVDVPLAEDLCRQYVSQGIYFVIGAFDEEQIVGFGALCESHSLYAEGTFGIIQEFYVMPEYRSKGVGKNLISEIVKFSRNKGWKRLELCTPPVPEFKRTVDFYKTNGFEITGGCKMKYPLK